MRTSMGRGRFGPVFLADDVENEREVVVRVFERVDATIVDALLEALRLLCSSPLDHPAIARPLSCGSEDGVPFLVHSYLPGTPLDGFIARHGPQPLEQVVVPIAQVAAAIDFAAAAGVHHGLLGARDIILSGDGAGVTGFGLAQALSRAGIHVPGAAASHADDIYALAAIAFRLLTGEPFSGVLDRPFAPTDGVDPATVRAVLASALAIDAEVRPATALDFARALQAALPLRPPAVPVVPEPDDSRVEAAAIPVAAAPIPAADVAGGALLRAPADDPLPMTFADTHEPSIVRPGEVPMRDLPFAQPPTVSRGPVFLAVAVALLAAIAGFAGGFTVGQRTEPTLATPPAQDVAEGTPQPRPEGTQGRSFTEAPIDDRASADGVTSRPLDESEPPISAPGSASASSRSASAPTAPSASAPTATPADRPADRPADKTADKPADKPADRPAPARVGPGSMEVLSRPAGAEVFVDGRLVGRTPVSLPDVEPGGHAVRISLPGHQRWATSVDVRPGVRTRVAASLELVTDPQ